MNLMQQLEGVRRELRASEEQRLKARPPKDHTPEQTDARSNRLDEVVALIREQGRLTAEDVAKAYGCATTTAQRYLRDLKAQGRVKRIITGLNRRTYLYFTDEE